LVHIIFIINSLIGTTKTKKQKTIMKNRVLHISKIFW